MPIRKAGRKLSVLARLPNYTSFEKKEKYCLKHSNHNLDTAN